MGARSDANSTRWILDDGTILNNPTYHQSTYALCQELLVNLPLVEEAEFISLLCDVENYYLCKMKCKCFIKQLYLLNWLSYLRHIDILINKQGDFNWKKLNKEC